MLDQRSPIASNPDKMDINNANGSPAGLQPQQGSQPDVPWGPPGLNMGGGLPPWPPGWIDPTVATVKGKGKGFPGKGFGSWGPAKGFGDKGSNDSKGKGKGFQNPYNGYCAHCHLIGHSSNYRPYLGKGFKGSCKGCGVYGHRIALCPKGKGKGKGNANSVEPTDHAADGQPGGLRLGLNGDASGSDEPKPEPPTAGSAGGQDPHNHHAVSYTHLTLPTICSV